MEKPATSPVPQPVVWVLCLLIAVVCIWLRPRLGEAVWIPGASVLALVLGTLAVHLPGVRASLAAPSKVVVKKGIPYAIVLIGFGLNLGELWQADVLGVGSGRGRAGYVGGFWLHTPVQPLVGFGCAHRGFARCGHGGLRQQRDHGGGAGGATRGGGLGVVPGGHQPLGFADGFRIAPGWSHLWHRGIVGRNPGRHDGTCGASSCGCGRGLWGRRVENGDPVQTGAGQGS